VKPVFLAATAIAPAALLAPDPHDFTLPAGFGWRPRRANRQQGDDAS